MAVQAPMPSARVITARAVNAGFLISWRNAKRRSFISQCYDGIDFSGAARGQPAGKGRDREQRGDYTGENQGILRAQFRNCSREEAGDTEGTAESQKHPNGTQNQSLPQNHPEHVMSL